MTSKNSVRWTECGDEDATMRALTAAGAQCTQIQVPENPETPDGRKITLRVARIQAVSQNPKPDPLFVFAGGPGQSATAIGPQLVPFLHQINQARDLVFVDQRGTGGSNLLQCELPEDDSVAGLFDVSDRSEQVAACKNELSEKADLRQYTTPIAMDDIDLVRRELGYDKINLWGASYGTRAALVFLRQHGNHVRTVVLDGVAPTNMELPSNVAQDGRDALHSVFQSCRSLPECDAAFPDLEERFYEWLDSLESPACHPEGSVADSCHPEGSVADSKDLKRSFGCAQDDTRGCAQDDTCGQKYTVRHPRTGVEGTVNLTAQGVVQAVQSVL